MGENVHGDRLRMVMRHVPSPVTVVTATHAGESRGITIGSFASTSLDPPLISFNVARDAQMFPIIEGTEQFVVHVLSDDQAHLGNRFSIPEMAANEQFRDIPHHKDAADIPVLDGAVSVIACTKRNVYDAGDHVIVLGEVVAIEHHGDRRPLLYFDRKYHAIGPAAELTLFDPVQESANGDD